MPGKCIKLFCLFAFAAASAGCSRDTVARGGEKAPVSAGPVFSLASDSFQANAPIPADFTCDGANTTPALRWGNAPAEAKSLALVVRDPDAPSGSFLHWAVVDIPPGVIGLAAGAPPPAPARQLANDAGSPGYFGPCPPSGTHRYVFTLYALNIESYAGGLAGLEERLEEHSLGKAVLTGLYKRKK